MIFVRIEPEHLERRLADTLNLGRDRLILAAEGSSFRVTMSGIQAGPAKDLGLSIFLKVAALVNNQLTLHLVLEPGGALGKAHRLGASFGFGANQWAEPWLRQKIKKVAGVEMPDAHHITVDLQQILNPAWQVHGMAFGVGDTILSASGSFEGVDEWELQVPESG